ncbi:uncharacterized protein LOC18422409 isoform X3 [Amborella trichopoda]|uniref:uncharacterized protein LOC18422409 isoform X3 n=1 Tax=Amborella trichopoda TaxID=13333 RepID=UPI0009C18A18|nr:uncharacterized protein LOC18422409 isoform X3 [Amborella trichopoda]|eukprot:XP_020521588.1 uncharacterized protein LOC18422409 isoform X3 [Amborella trichopoda]
MAILLSASQKLFRPPLALKIGDNCHSVWSCPLKMASRDQLQAKCQAMMPSSTNFEIYDPPKAVWVWTEKKDVMTAAVERGWNTFVFSSHSRKLADEWSSIAMIKPLFIQEGEIFDSENKRIAIVSEISCPEQLEQLQLLDGQAENVVISLMDWQVIPAENIVAVFQGSQTKVLAIGKTPSEAQLFLEALEQGLSGVVLKIEDSEVILKLKVQVAGMGDRVCVDLCTLMRPGEGLLVGSYARGLLLVHSECLASSYISSRPFRVNAGPVHAYVAVPGGKTCYLSELQSGKEVIVVDLNGRQRTAVVGRVKIETRPLILVEAKLQIDDSDDKTKYSILLQNAETVGLVCPFQVGKHNMSAIPVTTLKVGDEVLLRVQGGARHTGIEIQEFIIEK